MNLKRRIESLGAYQSLFLLAFPTATVEPLKLVAVAVAGKGHWIAGTTMIVTCYLLSFVLVERLFRLVKPKLLTIPWFATVWTANSFSAHMGRRVVPTAPPRRESISHRKCRSISTAVLTRSQGERPLCRFD